MTIYYLVVDYNGWCVFSNRYAPVDYGNYEPFYFSTTCLDVANKMCSILRQRNKY